MTPKLTIGVDVDDTVADLCSAWVARYNALYGDTLKEWTTWDIPSIVKPECGLRVYDILKDPNLYNKVPQVDSALWGVWAIRQMGHRVVFVTSCGSDAETVAASAGAKLDWLRIHGFLGWDHGAAKDFIVAADKTLVKLDLHIDDRPETVEAFGSRGILFDRAHNRDFHHSAGYRARSWDDVVDLVARFPQSYEFKRSQKPVHVCGAQGFGSVAGDYCDACAAGHL